MGATHKPEWYQRVRSMSSSSDDSSLYDRNSLELPKPLKAVLDEHRYINRLLILLKAESQKIKQHESVEYSCMGDIMHYIVHFPDRYHHPKEDLIFRKMSGLSAQASKIIRQLYSEHEKIDGHTMQIYQLIEERENSCVEQEVQILAKEIDCYIERLQEHIELEESTVLMPAWKSLSVRDWQEIDKAAPAISDPIFGPEIANRYLSLMQRYINYFVTISSSGSTPVREIEFVLSNLEQGVLTLFEASQLPRVIVNNRMKSLHGRIRRFGTLFKQKSLGDLCRSVNDEKKQFEEDWVCLFAEVKETLDSVHWPVNIEGMHSSLSTINLKTEEETLSYQEQPYTPSKNPTVSWQAVALNLSARMIIKPKLRRLNFDHPKGKTRFKSKPAKIVPPGTRIKSVAEHYFDAVWIIPKAQADTEQTILHLPGGGFFAPDSDMHRIMLGKLACDTKSRAMLVSYRLLPRFAFPAALEDALTAYRYLLDTGIRPENIMVSGDSAGGNLALAMLLAARDEGLPMPAACALISPCTDMSFAVDSRDRNRWKDPFLPSRNSTSAHARYAGEFPLDHPLVSPIFGSLKGFPPMFAFVSSTEMLLDDTLIVARKARSEGVDFQVEIWESLPHAWPLFSFLPEAQAAIARLGEFMVDQLRNNEWSAAWESH